MVDKTIADLSAAASVVDGTLFETENPTGPASEKTTALQIQAYLMAKANTFTAKQTFDNFIKLQRALEKVTITADNPASGDNNYDVLTQSIQYFTTANDTNWVWNIRGDGTTTLNSLMAVGDALTVTGIVTNTGTAYYMTSLKIDGNPYSAPAIQWMGAAAPSAGTVNKRDTYTFTIIKTATDTFIVQASFAAGN